MGISLANVTCLGNLRESLAFLKDIVKNLPSNLADIFKPSFLYYKGLGPELEILRLKLMSQHESET